MEVQGVEFVKLLNRARGILAYVSESEAIELLSQDVTADIAYLIVKAALTIG